MSLKLTLVRVLYWLKGRFENPTGLFEALGVERSDRILEIGCAIGYHTFPLAALAPDGKIYAVDVWEEGLAYLNGKIGARKNIETICCDAGTVELPPSSLDKVVCFDTLHDVPDSQRAVERWAESLRAGGRFYYRDPEITPERVEAFSGEKLRQAGAVQGVHVLVRH